MTRVLSSLIVAAMNVLSRNGTVAAAAHRNVRDQTDKEVLQRMGHDFLGRGGHASDTGILDRCHEVGGNPSIQLSYHFYCKDHPNRSMHCNSEIVVVAGTIGMATFSSLKLGQSFYYS